MDSARCISRGGVAGRRVEVGAVESAAAALPRLQLVVLNAGICASGALVQQRQADIDRMLQLNVLALLESARICRNVTL